MIAVVDYGAGNLTSVMKALDHLGIDAIVTREPEVVVKADKIILLGPPFPQTSPRGSAVPAQAAPASAVMP